MSRGRAILVATLLGLPVVVLVVAGLYALWDRGWLGWLGWVLPVCWCIAFLLLRFRPRRAGGAAWSEGPRTALWTPRDEEIHENVRREQQAASEIPVSQLSDPHFYLQSALDLSTDVARRYHPKSSDPVSSLTVVEVLAAAQLAMEDTSSWLHANVPGSHLLTIHHWRALSHAPRWVRLVSDASWLVSLWWNPANLPRWVASNFASTSATQEVEASLLAAFHQAFLHNVLLHCIEMNSGRLRGGVARYRAALAGLPRARADRRPDPRPIPSFSHGDENRIGTAIDSQRVEATGDQSAIAPNTVRIAVVGQVNAGKSSLINAILGENRAACDVLATTDAIERYRFSVPASDERLEFHDTPGYGGAELTAQQQKAIQSAWSQADLVLLVMDVTSPARQADWRLVNELSAWYGARPHLKPPPLIGVLTHIDGLSPTMEWQPPYDWRTPTRPKEQTLRAAVGYVEQIFGDSFSAVIPVCSDSAHARLHGIQEWLLPAVLASLTKAKASLIVRALHHDADAERVLQLVRQLRVAGVKLLKVLLDTRSD